MAQNNERNPHTIVVKLPALSAAASIEFPIGGLYRDAVIRSVSLVSSTAIAASGANYVSVALKDRTKGVNLAAGDTQAGLAAWTQQQLALVPSVGDAHQGGANADGPGVTDTMADRGDIMSVLVASTGSTALVADEVSLEIVLHYL